MADVVKSYRGVKIRLTDERWAHITEEHSELAGMRFDVLETVSQPRGIYQGGLGESIAVKEIEAGKFLIVIYREDEPDGFIITAFITRRSNLFERRNLIWSPSK